MTVKQSFIVQQQRLQQQKAVGLVAEIMVWPHDGHQHISLENYSLCKKIGTSPDGTAASAGLFVVVFAIIIILL